MMWRYVCGPYEDPDCGYQPEPEEPDYDRAYEERKEAELDARELVNNKTI